MRLRLAAILCFWTCSLVAAELPAGGQDLLPEAWQWRAQGDGVSLESVAVGDLPAGVPVSAHRLSFAGAPGHWWAADARVTVPGGVAAEARGVVAFWCRAVAAPGESAVARFQVFLQRDAPPWHKPLSRSVAAGSDWRFVVLPWHVRDAMAPPVVLALGLSQQPQQIELAGMRLIAFPDLAVADLPESVETFEGRAADAPWRLAAAERIREHRMADLTVRVVDAAGQPVPGARVRVEQQRHAFQFGTALALPMILGEGADAERYRAEAVRLFNAASSENFLKAGAWRGEWGPTWGRERALAALDWMHAAGFDIRGHVLVWPGWKNLPRSWRGLSENAEAVNTIPEQVLAHIDDIAGATAETVQEWDVLNEPFANHDLMGLFGDEIMVDWFVRAAANRPGVPLFINDYGILSGGGFGAEHQAHYEATIRFLLDAGAPLGGIGLQGHFAYGGLTGIPRVHELLDRFAAFGLPIRITELDVDTRDRALQADYLRDLLTIAFAHPAVVGVQQWGFWAGRHWRPDGALFAQDWSPKPALEAYEALVFDQWWTNDGVVTADDGRARLRVYKGHHHLRVEQDGRRAVGVVVVGDHGGAATLRLQAIPVP